jgi:phage antirepressor YoqD-like protein
MSNQNNQFMTIKEVARVYSVNEITIRRAIKKLFPDLIKNGITTLINELQATRISQYLKSNQYVLKINPDKIVEVTKREKLETIAAAQNYLIEMVSELKAENKELKDDKIKNQPKVEFYETVIESKDAVPIGEVAKRLSEYKLGQNNLYQFLRSHQILQYNNLPYQRYIDRGYFRVIMQKFNAGDKVKTRSKTLAYPKGMDFIRKLLKRAYSNQLELF